MSTKASSRRFPAFDVGLLIALVLLSVLVAAWNGSRAESDPDCGPWVGLALQTVVLLTLLVRRRRPLMVLAVALVASVVMTVSVWPAPGLLVASREQSGVWIAMSGPFAAYSAVVYSSRTRVAWALTGLLVLVAARFWELSFVVAAPGVLVTAVPGLLGMYVGARRGLIEMLTERAERAEREQFLLAERARVEERVRLAGEMHDVVTHRVSLMVLQAGALWVSSSDEVVRAEAEGLRAAGCQALEELRDVVGVLRSPASLEALESAELVMPSAGAGAGAGVGVEGVGLSVLVEESRAVGVDVELDELGDRSVWSPVVARTAYRVVQEALTNVRKHAPGSSVRVEVRHEAGQVRLRVANSAARDAVDTELASSGSGSGLKGLRQRVELVGGTFEFGPVSGGGFHVESVLPAECPTTVP
ncbi:sensor histidine kinase [Streptomyces sp. NPDC056486]|uniref:sensor histidine kinase n=1 Tax=Streptomyces sp. NPDC056486 TaxID=3345835 RepID=UPI0036BCA68D